VDGWRDGWISWWSKLALAIPEFIVLSNRSIHHYLVFWYPTCFIFPMPYTTGEVAILLGYGDKMYKCLINYGKNLKHFCDISSVL
jgi:hypothetical protein